MTKEEELLDILFSNGVDIQLLLRVHNVESYNGLVNYHCANQCFSKLSKEKFDMLTEFAKTNGYRKD